MSITPDDEHVGWTVLGFVFLFLIFPLNAWLFAQWWHQPELTQMQLVQNHWGNMATQIICFPLGIIALKKGGW